MSQHRAPRRRADRHRPAAGAASFPSSPSTAGRHRAGTPEAPAAFRRTGRDFRPSGFLVAGASALVVAAAGAMSVGSAQAAHKPEQPPVHALAAPVAAAAVERADLRGGRDSLGSDLGRDGRPQTISRSAGREALDRAQQRKLEQAAEKQAAARDEALADLANAAEDRARQIKANMWVLPVQDYDITATFGAGGGLWSSDHTGLDFAASYGAPVASVAEGVVTDTGYAGAYGNRVIVEHADGTETWYCHLDGFAVSSGDRVSPGTAVGSVGMSGNTTGPHLHFEVRPDPDVPVDPYAALAAHGLRP